MNRKLFIVVLKTKRHNLYRKWLVTSGLRPTISSTSGAFRAHEGSRLTQPPILSTNCKVLVKVNQIYYGLHGLYMCHDMSQIRWDQSRCHMYTGDLQNKVYLVWWPCHSMQSMHTIYIQMFSSNYVAVSILHRLTDSHRSTEGLYHRCTD